ncbi:MAG: HAMP domain-containing histidine kinase [Beijerinckiaceae bacterium]|nr:HAMP domain-containing histidine kinase [Beijerinckiaceae bacterium]MCI0735421.1 HAMP domain-containing histidine kinase [Beijerinckiaceae bacterium]
MRGGFFEHVQVSDRPAFLKAISDAAAGSPAVTTVLRLCVALRFAWSSNAEPVFLWLEMRARRGEECQSAKLGESDGTVVAVFRDVTGSKRRDSELDNTRARLAEATIAKQHFLAHAGHEIRAPLNAIAGFSELLADPSLAPHEFEKQCEYAAIIHQSAQHLLAVVNSITDLSLLQSGALKIKPECFAVAPQIDLCCDMVRLQARNSEVELLCADRADLDTIIGDKRLFTQILVNLLTNAVKFTPAKGSVTISARAEANSLLVQVIDTGIGIGASDLDRLGDPFFQANASSRRQEKGMGLGLSIVRGLVGILGGEMTVASEPERGTCVHVRLPLDSQGLTAGARGPVKIETAARLPVPDEPGKNLLATVKKIA